MCTFHQIATILKISLNIFFFIHSQIHHLYTAVQLDFKEGERVYVGGKLSSKKIIIENKTFTQPIIQAYQIFALNSKNNLISAADETNSIDLNSVELLTQVCGDTIIKDNHTIIRVVTHYMNQSKQEIQPNFYAIFVHDPDLCNIVCGTVEKRDRIYVKGYLSANTHTTANGKRLQSGFIVAKHIEKVQRFDRNQSMQQESTEAEGEFKM